MQNVQSNTCKLNLSTNEKYQTSWSSWLFSSKASIIQHMQTHQHNVEYKEQQGQEAHNPLNRWKKALTKSNISLL
jgi:hypothetical protein